MPVAPRNARRFENMNLKKTSYGFARSWLHGNEADTRAARAGASLRTVGSLHLPPDSLPGTTKRQRRMLGFVDRFFLCGHPAERLLGTRPLGVRAGHLKWVVTELWCPWLTELHSREGRHSQ